MIRSKLIVLPLLALLFASNSWALTPEEVQKAVAEAQSTVQNLPSAEEDSLAIAIAVSLSMPRASLLRLGQDAKDAGLTLTFRGVGQEVKTQANEKPRTVLETYGKGLIRRHLEDFRFLSEAGVNVQIDPVLFARHHITDVPRVMVVPVCRTACEKSEALLVARGDVTLRYALEHLKKELQEQLSQEPENPRFIKAQTLIDRALQRLGDRP